MEPLPISGAYLVSGTRHNDSRGYLQRLFDISELGVCMSRKNIVQVNQTRTLFGGTVRGMHCQLPPYAETKLVNCVKGKVFDVIVDLRESSPSFGKWWAKTLKADDNVSVLIPEGCAHGLQTLEDECEMLYFHTAEYSALSEAAVNPFDPQLGIEWPVAVTNISDRDRTEARSVDWFRGIPW